MKPFYDNESFYQRLMDLQDKLRQSEEERMKLEEKFNKMIQRKREIEQIEVERLKYKYCSFLENERFRNDRNDHLLRSLDRIEYKASMLTAKTDRLRQLRRQYENLSRLNDPRPSLTPLKALPSTSRTTGNAAPASPFPTTDFRNKYLSDPKPPNLQPDLTDNVSQIPSKFTSSPVQENRSVDGRYLHSPYERGNVTTGLGNYLNVPSPTDSGVTSFRGTSPDYNGYHPESKEVKFKEIVSPRISVTDTDYENRRYRSGQNIIDPVVPMRVSRRKVYQDDERYDPDKYRDNERYNPEDLEPKSKFDTSRKADNIELETKGYRRNTQPEPLQTYEKRDKIYPVVERSKITKQNLPESQESTRSTVEAIQQEYPRESQDLPEVKPQKYQKEKQLNSKDNLEPRQEIPYAQQDRNQQEYQQPLQENQQDLNLSDDQQNPIKNQKLSQQEYQQNQDEIPHEYQEIQDVNQNDPNQQIAQQEYQQKQDVVVKEYPQEITSNQQEYKQDDYQQVNQQDVSQHEYQQDPNNYQQEDNQIEYQQHPNNYQQEYEQVPNEYQQINQQEYQQHPNDYQHVNQQEYQQQHVENVTQQDQDVAQHEYQQQLQPDQQVTQLDQDFNQQEYPQTQEASQQDLTIEPEQPPEEYHPDDQEVQPPSTKFDGVSLKDIQQTSKELTQEDITPETYEHTPEHDTAPQDNSDVVTTEESYDQQNIPDQVYDEPYEQVPQSDQGYDQSQVGYDPGTYEQTNDNQVYDPNDPNYQQQYYNQNQEYDPNYDPTQYDQTYDPNYQGYEGQEGYTADPNYQQEYTDPAYSQQGEYAQGGENYEGYDYTQDPNYQPEVAEPNVAQEEYQQEETNVDPNGTVEPNVGQEVSYQQDGEKLVPSGNLAAMLDSDTDSTQQPVSGKSESDFDFSEPKSK